MYIFLFLFFLSYNVSFSVRFSLHRYCSVKFSFVNLIAKIIYLRRLSSYIYNKKHQLIRVGAFKFILMYVSQMR